ncbi:hypothetical protein ABFS83_10G000800 [Erythranthe nasuta]
MDVNPETSLAGYSESSRNGYIRHSLAVNNSSLHVISATCALCHRALSSDNETVDLETISICGDCKFLLLEDLDTASPDVLYPRRMRVSRRRYGSSESIESMFSQQLSQIISLARQSQPISFEHDIQSVDGDGAARRGSRRWRIGLSDSESDAFDSLYGENDSNLSFRRYRWASHGEVDTVVSYRGDSDDDHSFLENENYESDVESDTDIDPMNAGLYRWNSEEEDSEQEEADIEVATQLHSSSRSNVAYINWRRQFLSHEVAGTFVRRFHERVQSHSGDLLANLEESGTYNYVGESGDYLYGRGFGDILEHLAESESSRRGAPPASLSFISNIRCMTINEEKLDNMVCAICKETFSVGIVVNELPCFHMYHPCCILPWLSARNTCPLCRYELPTDDKDYEARKRNGDMNEYETLEDNIQHETNDDDDDDSDSQVDETCEMEQVVNAESGRGKNRWLMMAAPVVGMVGISLMMWFGNSSVAAAAYRRSPTSAHIHCPKDNGQRRWWSSFF